VKDEFDEDLVKEIENSEGFGSIEDRIVEAAGLVNSVANGTILKNGEKLTDEKAK
jgi:hypothetical protein